MDPEFTVSTCSKGSAFCPAPTRTFSPGSRVCWSVTACAGGSGLVGRLGWARRVRGVRG